MNKTLKSALLILIPGTAVAISVTLLIQTCSEPPYSLGQALTRALGSSFGVSLFCLFLFPVAKRWFASKLPFWGFCLSLWFLIMGTHEYALIKEDKRLRMKSDKEIQYLTENIYNLSAEPHTYTPAEYGDYAATLNFIQQLFDITKQERVKLLQIFETTSLDYILNPEKIYNCEHLVSSKNNLSTSLAQVTESEKKLHAYFLRAEKNIKADTSLNWSIKNTLLQEIKDSLESPDTWKSYNLQKRYVQRCMDFVEFLISRLGTYSVDKERNWIFENQDDVGLFHIHAQILEGILEEDSRIANQGQAKIDRLRNIFK